MGRAKKGFNDDPEIAVKQMARELANNSIVNKALARYIEQILEAVNEDTIQPLRDEIERLRAMIAASPVPSSPLLSGEPFKTGRGE